MKILLHICCGPCSIMPIKVLQDAGHEVTGYFYNPNIHPLTEYLKRREGALAVAAKFNIELIVATDEESYDTTSWLRRSSQVCNSNSSIMLSDKAQEAILGSSKCDNSTWLKSKNAKLKETPTRCVSCWNDRLRSVHKLAIEKRFDAFTSSLLYSRHQNHAVMFSIAASLAGGLVYEMGTKSDRVNPENVGFFYHDFRSFWQDGIVISKEWEIYRQQYCGCIFSENERYANELTKQNLELSNMYK